MGQKECVGGKAGGKACKEGGGKNSEAGGQAGSCGQVAAEVRGERVQIWYALTHSVGIYL